MEADETIQLCNNREEFPPLLLVGAKFVHHSGVDSIQTLPLVFLKLGLILADFKGFIRGVSFPAFFVGCQGIVLRGPGIEKRILGPYIKEKEQTYLDEAKSGTSNWKELFPVPKYLTSAPKKLFCSLR